MHGESSESDCDRHARDGPAYRSALQIFCPRVRPTCSDVYATCCEMGACSCGEARTGNAFLMESGNAIGGGSNGGPCVDELGNVRLPYSSMGKYDICTHSVGGPRSVLATGCDLSLLAPNRRLNQPRVGVLGEASLLSSI